MMFSDSGEGLTYVFFKDGLVVKSVALVHAALREFSISADTLCCKVFS